MSQEYSPTRLEQDLINAFWLLYPHVELENYPEIHKTCRSVGAIGHELYTSLVDNGYKITLDPNLVQNRGLPPEDGHFFDQVHCAGDLLSKLPPRKSATQSTERAEDATGQPATPS